MQINPTELSPVRQKILLMILFFCVSMSLMAPIASDTYLPKILDYKNHVTFIVQAKSALAEGQFPVRVSPQEHLSLNYPFFQFYSPFYYTLGGALHQWVTPNNPYTALKLTVLISFMLAAIYSYRCALLLTDNKKIATVTALSYICTPYMLINVLGRGAFTEFFAQGLLPMVLYYNLVAIRIASPFRTLILLAFSWSLLMMTHIITFVYASFFMGILFVLLAAVRAISFKSVIQLGFAYGLACLICAWTLAPAWDIQSLTPLKDRYTYDFNFITPLSNLISFTGVSPMPLPGNGIPMSGIYVSLGLPTLLALGVLISHAVKPEPRDRKILGCALIIYFCALFLAWTPFNIYKFLPTLLDIAQFSYRLLAQTSWIGLIIICITLSAAEHEKLLNHSFYILLTAIILLSTSPWIKTQPSSRFLSEDLKPEIDYRNTSYLPVGPFPKNEQLIYALEHPIQAKDEVRFLGEECIRENSRTICTLTSHGANQLTPVPSLYYPQGLHITVDGKAVPYEIALTAKYLIAAVRMPHGTHQVTVEYVGYTWANLISLAAVLASSVAFLISYIYNYYFAVGFNKLQYRHHSRKT